MMRSILLYLWEAAERGTQDDREALSGRYDAASLEVSETEPN